VKRLYIPRNLSSARLHCSSSAGDISHCQGIWVFHVHLVFFISCVSMETRDPKQGSLHKISTIMDGNLVSSMQGLCNRFLQESFLHIFISYLINVYGNLHNCAWYKQKCQVTCHLLLPCQYTHMHILYIYVYIYIYIRIVCSFNIYRSFTCHLSPVTCQLRFPAYCFPVTCHLSVSTLEQVYNHHHGTSKFG